MSQASSVAPGLHARLVTDLSEVDAASWDRLVGGEHPFVEHAFLSLLERSGSVGAGTGWQPVHLLIESDGELVAAAPTYLKAHSFGEYIFDWSWAEAAERAGIAYYPKLVVGVPHTPATGPRLLVRPDWSEEAAGRALLAGLEEVRAALGASGVHLLFLSPAEAAIATGEGYAHRTTHQYHWHNAGYATFDDFLDALRAPSRKQIRRERRALRDAGIDIELVRGESLDAAAWDELYQLYRTTTDRKWGSSYLTREFFVDAGPAVKRRAVVVWARRAGRTLGMSLSFEKGSTLYGRYWGAIEPVPFLHFELCYYRLIEYAIASGKRRFEAGAQGEHKLKRGFEPTYVHSAHRIVDAGLQQAITRFVDKERRLLARELPDLARLGPYRRGGRDGS